MSIPRILVILATACMIAPLALALEAEPADAKIVGIPPNGGGQNDPWVDANGDTMHGVLNMGGHAVRMSGLDLAGLSNGSLRYGARYVCFQGTTCVSGATYTGVSPVSVTGTSISLAGGCSSGQILKWTGAAWGCSADASNAYSAGTGLLLSGTTFSADANYLQRRVANACAAGSAIRAIASDGAITCESDDSATYAAGTGLTLAGTTFSADTGYLQRRVGGTCGAQGIASIHVDGTVSCSAAWLAGGNSGSNPATQFIGTTDDVRLEIRVNNAIAQRYIPGVSPSILGGHSANSIDIGVIGGVVGGGGYVFTPNRVTDQYGVVAGGASNTAGDSAGTASNAAYASVGGGSGNSAAGSYSTVAGGVDNHAVDRGAIGGGSANEARAVLSTIAGGLDNIAGEPGGAGRASVGGGQSNEARAGWTTVAGGGGNSATSEYATVGGGGANHASGAYSAISGGRQNRAYGSYGQIGSGEWNVAYNFSVVGGGYNNNASGENSSIGGGQFNTASGARSTVPGGSGNHASGAYSFAAGRGASASHEGSFVWSDSGTGPVASPASNTFSVRAGGGVWLGTTSSPSIPAGRFLQTSTGAYLTSGGTWTSTSDRAAKEEFRSIDPREVLARVLSLPISTWKYKAESEGTRHMGPVAQDFYAAFGLGDDDRSIAAIDEAGVALAAIQGLHQEIAERDARIADLETRLAALEARLT